MPLAPTAAVRRSTAWAHSLTMKLRSRPSFAWNNGSIGAPSCRTRSISVDRAARDAQRLRRHVEEEEAEERQTVHRVRVDLTPRRRLGAAERVVERELAGHEGALHANVIARAALQPRRVPGVENLPIRAGQQRPDHAWRPGLLAKHERAEDDPLAQVAAAGEDPVTFHPVAALDR